MRCNKPGCECCTCMDCGRPSENCICELKERTKRLLEKDMDDYDFTNIARSLLQDWLSLA